MATKKVNETTKKMVKKETATKKQESTIEMPKEEKIETPQAEQIPVQPTTPEEVHKGNKILFATSEAAPYIRSGGLGDVAGALPKALTAIGEEVRIILPLYSDIPPHFRNTMNYIGYTYVDLGWRKQYCGVFSQNYNGITYYFIDNEYYFARKGLYGHFDDAERFAFFSKAVLQAMLLVDYIPDVIHCNDWHTALIPVFLDTFFRGSYLRYTKTLFTIHNIEFQGKYDTSLCYDVLGLPEDKATLVDYAGCTNFMKGGIECANAVSTVSPTYAGEILDSYYGYGMESILSARSYKLFGIINGIDTVVFDPATDSALFKNYDATTVSEGKAVNKAEVCKMVNLPYDSRKPLIAMVTRLTTQKGLDLLTAVAEDLLSSEITMIVLGTGDYKYESALKDLEHKYGAKLRIIINFSSDLASKLYAASDIFLMPSKFEPCGLSQMIAMRYGSIPVVRETGGLKDSVKPYNPETKDGTGYTFYSYNAHDMLSALWRAISCYYNDKDSWNKLVHNAMTTDYSWNKSALKYKELYNKIKAE